jgi:hypothetical protein
LEEGAPGQAAGAVFIQDVGVQRCHLRMFFSEEKNQKTFMSAPVPTSQAMAGNHPPDRN